MEKNFKAMVTIFIGYFLLSLFSNTLSPFITTIKSTYNVSSYVIAFIPSVVYCAALITNIVGAKLMPWLGIKNGLYLGIVFEIFASLIIVFSKSFYVILTGYFMAGLATGMACLYLSTMLSLLPQKYQKFSFANACFGLGGILILPIDRFILKMGIKFNYTYIIHILLISFYIILVSKMDRRTFYKSNSKCNTSFSILKNPMILLLCIAVFFYVGAEISTTNWTGTFLKKYYGISKIEVPNILLSFWILFTIGRSLGDKFLERVGQLRFLSISPLISILGIIILLFGKSKLQALTGFAIIGISISIMYPALQGYIVQHVTEKNIPSASAVTMIFNNLGATFLTYIIGFAGGIKITYVFIIQILFYIYIALISVYYRIFKPGKV
ncbi:sugar MFS transporter [Clostridium ljungdahlii]|uniref:Predicted permease n=1 Tax=Clostridium ljungdahlii (strain ATCC 55383 / DSM 13528 / PETC) TaxID=748727 RepID=D8GR24_CLOLD|nr:MFS transporter [Clostridium ljungdahlii]ADK16329.1 predicted permease [Clostridium ljungdahlii DSM 13528]OAA89797.1 Protein TsgA [Clostridium ljungdahlii DSM 13528]